MSNHLSAANLRFPGDDARLDLTDLYAFQSPGDASMTTLVMKSSSTTFLVLRQSVGNTLLLALEVLVAAGLVRTVAVSPTVHNVLVLGLVVVIRTFLSFSLQTEIDGVSPWRRAAHHDETSLTTPRSRLARRQDPANDRAGERERSS